MILTLLMYGSRARGDNRPKSDVDLLAIVEGGSIRHEILKGGVSTYHYPANLFLDQARKGDLFAYHIVSEGKLVHDTLDYFKTLRKEFLLRKSYDAEIRSAYIITRFFFTRQKLLTDKRARKRLIWALRTILIATAAEKREPTFSSSALARFSGMPTLKAVIDDRNQTNIPELIDHSRRVARKFAEPRVVLDWPNAATDQRTLMTTEGGIVQRTLEFLPLNSRPKGKQIMATSAAHTDEYGFLH